MKFENFKPLMSQKKYLDSPYLYALSLKLLENDLNWSSILLSEHLYRSSKHNETLLILLKGLYKINCDTRIVKLIEDNGHLMDDSGLKILYYKAKYRLGDKERARVMDSTISKLISDTRSSSDKKTKFSGTSENIFNTGNGDKALIVETNTADLECSVEIKSKSIELFFEAMTKPDVIKKKLLIESFESDNQNLESLFYLLKDDLITKKELKRILEKTSEAIKQIFFDIFFGFEGCKMENLFTAYRSCFYELPFYNPFYIFTYSKDLYHKGKKQLLFNLSFASLKLYPNSIYTYLSLGLYFLLLNDFSEAKKCLLKGAEIEKNGYLFLYLGICYSGLRECENAVSCFNLSHRILIGSWKPVYYLACEHQKMTNYDRATYYFKEGLKLERNAKIQEKYVSLLVFCEYYEEALSYLASQNNPKHFLLRVYCLLFKGKINDSKIFLNQCEKDWKYYATAAYIEHLLNNLEKAADLYSRSLLIHNETIIEDLMSLVIENQASKTENDVYKYCTELFDNLFSKFVEFDVV